MSVSPRTLRACLVVAALAFSPVALDAVVGAIAPSAPAVGSAVEDARQGVAQRGLRGIAAAWKHAVAIDSPSGGLPANDFVSDALSATDEADDSNVGRSVDGVHEHADAIPLVPGACGHMGSEEDGVVGYQVFCSAEDAQRACDEAMAQSGWQVFPLGGVCGSTYLKAFGERRWALATSSESEGVASVVVRCG